MITLRREIICGINFRDFRENFGQIREIKSSRKILKYSIRENKSTRNVKKITRENKSTRKGGAKEKGHIFF